MHISGQVKKGLEILGFAYVDVNLDEGYFLKAEQTFKDKKFKGKIPKYLKGLKNCDILIAWYLRMIEENSALLKYLYTGEQHPGKGRPKKYEGDVDMNDLREDVFTTEVVKDRGEKIVVHSATVWAVSLKREVKVVIADYMNPDKKTQNRKVYFSTNLELSADDILKLYRARFKIEFSGTQKSSPVLHTASPE